MFYASADEKTLGQHIMSSSINIRLYFCIKNLDKTRSILIPAGQTPIIAFRQIHEYKLGTPYSVCVAEHEHNLKFFRHYTMGHCLEECMGRDIGWPVREWYFFCFKISRPTIKMLMMYIVLVDVHQNIFNLWIP